MLTVVGRVSEAKRPWRVKRSLPLFQEWLGLNGNIDSHFVDPKKLFLVFFFRGNSCKDVVRRRGYCFCVGFRVSAFFFLQIFTRYTVNKKIRTLYDNRIVGYPATLHRKYYLFNFNKL